jgi:uncharacterized protein
MPLFAAAMVAVGVNMLLPKKESDFIDVKLSPRNAAPLLISGALVGAVSGFFGIGGGFLIVPGLMAATGMAIANAVSSSLVSVSAFGASTAASYALNGLIEWRVAAFFVVGGVLGGLIGMRLGRVIQTYKGLLQKLFAGLIFVVAAYVLYQSV